MKSSAVLAVLVLVGIGAYPAQSQKYTVIDLGTLPGDSMSAGAGVNIWGHVVGCSGVPGYACPLGSVSTGGFLWTPSHGMRPLPLRPGDTSTGARSINDFDQVAGWSGYAPNGTFPSHAVIWTKDDNIHDLGTLGGAGCPNCSSWALSISDTGLVVGSSELMPDSGVTDPFLWTDDFGVIDLTLLGYVNSSAEAVNNFGAIAGQTYFANKYDLGSLWSRATGMRDVGSLPGGQYSLALGLNDLGHVVGYSEFKGGDYHYFHAFVWSAGSGIQDLGTLTSGLSTSEALGINDLDEVVGYTQYNQFAEYHAFLWSRRTGMLDLNNFIDPKTGWVLISANAINLVGQMTGYGTINGQTHAFLLSPR